MKTIKQRLLFPLFQTPLDVAHEYWRHLLNPGDSVIDATCGNRYDTLFLAKTVINSNKNGNLIAIDIQSQAIENTRKLLKENFAEELWNNISFYQQCHSTFPAQLIKESVALIVYNLGYLPGNNKSLTSMPSTTLKSLNSALLLIKPGGAISITCYPGHEAGRYEEEAVLHFGKSLDPLIWSCCHHQWSNRQNAPSLFLIQRGKLSTTA
jgi:methylase of polypeptide subunit release factors